MEKLFDTNGTKFVVTYNEKIIMIINAQNIDSAKRYLIKQLS